MRKMFVDKEIDVNIDSFDGFMWHEGHFTVLEADTYRNSLKSLKFTPAEARRIGKQMVAYADTYDARVAKAKERAKVVRSKLKESD